MAMRKKKPWPPPNYPPVDLVTRGCRISAIQWRDAVLLTVPAKLHTIGLRKTTALLQVFDIATKAAQWMLRDLSGRDPRRLFTPYRKRKSNSYMTRGIAGEIARRYRATILSRFTLNSSVFTGLCAYLAAMISSWLQKITEADQKGYVRRYYECAEFVVDYGKHQGKSLRALPRDAVFGFAFLQPTRQQCERALKYLDTLINGLPEEAVLRSEAAAYKMEYGHRRGDRLDAMRPATWHRLRALVQRDLGRMEQINAIRGIAQDFLRYTPDSFPSIKSGVLSNERRADLTQAYLQALADYAALPDINNPEISAAFHTDNERALFAELQKRAYAATNQPRYIRLQWERADGAVKQRDTALLYEPNTGRYMFMVHIFHRQSRHCRPIRVQRTLIDVNNPDIVFRGRERASIAALFELEFSEHERRLLDRVRGEAALWKTKGKFSGPVRAARLQAQYDEQHDRWWFQVMVSVGIKLQRVREPQSVVGAHINPDCGWFVCVMELDGVIIEQFQLDELRIARLLGNKYPQEQARLKAQQRTAKERHHRLSDAITVICNQHNAICAIENISYRRSEPGPQQLQGQDDNSRTVVDHLKYKLPLAELPELLNVKGVAPRRDCGRCGHRHEQAPIRQGLFRCQACEQHENVGANAAQEVCRRALWLLAGKKQPAPRKARQTDVSEAAVV